MADVPPESSRLPTDGSDVEDQIVFGRHVTLVRRIAGAVTERIELGDDKAR